MLLIFLVGYFDLVIDLHILSLCSLLWSLDVKLFHAFLAGGSLKFKQDMNAKGDEQEWKM